MERLRISENNRYFVRGDGKPFIWIADTAWTMPQRMKWDDADYYMQKRKAQGFTVLQIVALDPERDVEMRNPAGKKALIDDNLLTPNEAYFEYLDWILDKAEEYGFYVLLLPVWGQLVVGHDWAGRTYERTVTEGNAYEYGCWIGSRYKDRKNIIWCLGGDRQPIHLGVDYKDVWRRMAEGLAKGITGKELGYDSSTGEWRELMITYHACHEMETGECSTMSYWTGDEAWISFIMLQSGHGTKPKNYELVKKEYDRPVAMPVWDGEPAYEMMPTTWPVIKEFHGDWIVRKRAYWSLFAGSFGHTYGHASVWCTISERERNEISKYTWYEALEHPGAYQIKVLRDFLESRDLSSCRPAQEILKSQEGDKEEEMDQHLQACISREGSFACIYFPSGGKAAVDVSGLAGKQLQLWWFNPRDGKCYLDAATQTEQPAEVTVSGGVLEVGAPTQGSKEDWVLVIDAEGKEQGIPGRAQSYHSFGDQEELKKVFEW